MMFRRILVPLDGSAGAERALPRAARIARSAGGSLVLLHVIPPSAWLEDVSRQARETALSAERKEQLLINASNYLGAAIAAYSEDLAGVSPEMDIACGLTSHMLLSTAYLEQVDLVVMCSHREAGLGQWGSESIALQSMRRSPVPLLILNEHGMATQQDITRPLRVIVLLDGSLFAEAALEPAARIITQLAGSERSELCLISVVTDQQGSEYMRAESYLQAIRERLSKRFQSKEESFTLTSSVKTGEEVAETVLAHIKENEARFSHLIVMATHGREGTQRLVLGSVAERVLDAKICPLLAVCPLNAATRPVRQGQAVLGRA